MKELSDKRKIKCKWIVETADWNKATNSYENRQSTETERTISMQLIKKEHGTVIQFFGGPTGYESYYVEDLMNNHESKSKDLCICGGTVNSWPRCIVNRDTVFNFIKEYF